MSVHSFCFSHWYLHTIASSHVGSFGLNKHSFSAYMHWRQGNGIEDYEQNGSHALRACINEDLAGM